MCVCVYVCVCACVCLRVCTRARVCVHGCMRAARGHVLAHHRSPICPLDQSTSNISANYDSKGHISTIYDSKGLISAIYDSKGHILGLSALYTGQDLWNIPVQST